MARERRAAMNDLTFLFFLIPGLVLSVSAITLWLALRSHRRFRREVFGEENLSPFSPFFPTSSRGPQHHSGGRGGSGPHHFGPDSPHHFSGSADHGDDSSYSRHETPHHGHGPSHDYGSSSHDSGSSGSDSSSSFSGDSGSSSGF